ncbi:monocarboxylate transporter 6-like [Stegodyphus dumicola]|uniref:monocarboxylate transporter 6-like n=1 Tax=Stegodyphus dumicola TaxID=202533 RepID=UPI0015AF8C43|nr:monocarboxylate transporter 6-like [Stegodyphus dumicola]
MSANMSSVTGESPDHAVDVPPRATRMVKREVPPDGNRAWLFVFIAYLLSVVVSGLPPCFGPIKAAITEEFPDTSTSTLGQFPSLVSNLSLLLSPIATLVVLKCGPRLSLFLGGLFSVIGLGLSSFAKCAGFLVFSYGVVVGIGSSLIVASLLSQIAALFTSRKPLAFALYMCGECTGAFVLPFLIDFLLGEYGWRMVFFVLCVLNVPTCLAAAAFERPEFYFVEISEEVEIKNPTEEERPAMVVPIPEVPISSSLKLWHNIRDSTGLTLLKKWELWLMLVAIASHGFGSAGLKSIFENGLKEHEFPIGHTYCFLMTVFVRFTYGLFSGQSRIPRNLEYFLSSLANVGGAILMLGVGCETVAHYLVVLCLMAIGNGIWGVLTPVVIGENVGSIPKAFAWIKCIRGILALLFPLLKDHVKQDRGQEVVDAMSAALRMRGPVKTKKLSIRDENE